MPAGVCTCVCVHVCRQRKAAEDTQQSSHKEQVEALWQRLENAATAHTEEVQQLQQQLQDASNTHEEEERGMRQMVADASAAQEQVVQDLQQQLEEASVVHRNQVENLQQEHEEELSVTGKQQKAAISQVRLWGGCERGGGGGPLSPIARGAQDTLLTHQYKVDLNPSLVSGGARTCL